MKGEMNVANYNGIDVSKWQGEIDWAKVKSAGTSFAMIRSSARTTYTDPCLEQNVKGCEANGIPYGFYHYLYAKTVAEASAEAEHFMKTISKYSPTYPAVLDIEDESIQNLGKSLLTEMALAFLDKVEKSKYYAMLYTNPDWLKNRLNWDALKRFDVWLAHWTTEDRKNKDYPHGLWQYGIGKVDGVVGDVDVNIGYRDYPTIIKRAGLNNTSPPAPLTLYSVTATKSGLTNAKAQQLSAELSKLGMTTNITEEK